MKNLKALFLLAAAALAACAHAPARGPEHKNQAAPAVHYVEPGQFRAVLFPPPPPPGSPEQAADLAGVLAWQNKRTEADCLRAAKTADEDYPFFWGGSSPFPEPEPREVKEFFVRLAEDLEGSLETMKKRYQRSRPFMAHQEAQPCIKRPKSFSYPSGHTVFARVYSRVLADLTPERLEEFAGVADAISRDRVVGGVHYPADIAAGKAFGDLYYAELAKSPAYRAEIEKLRALLKK